MNAVTHILALTTDGNTWAYTAVFVLAFLESFPFTGLLFPGTILMLIAGGLIALGIYDFWFLIIVATLGNVCSNTLGYELAGRIRQYVRRKPKLWLQIERAQAYMRKHGAMSIFLSRFWGPVRSVIPVVAGIKKMERLLFYGETAVSALSASIIRLGLGYIAALLLQVAFLWVSRREGFLLGIVIFGVPAFILWKWTTKRGKNGLLVLLSLIQAGFNTLVHHPLVRPWIERYPRAGAFLRNRFSLRRFFGLPFTLFIFVIAYLINLLVSVVNNYLTHGPITVLDTQVANLLLTFRNAQLLKAFYAITLLANEKIVLSVAILMTAILWLKKKYMFIIILWTDLLLASAVVVNGKWFFGRLRPGEMYAAIQETYSSLPSGHATYAMALYGFVAYLALRSHLLSWRTRSTTLYACIAAILLIDLSRLYLGVHFLSDVIIGNLAGLIVLLVSIIIGEWLSEYRKHPPETRSVTRTTFASLAVFGAAIAAAVIISSPVPAFSIQGPMTGQTPKPIRNIMQAFDLHTPRFTETLRGVAQEPLNVLVVASDDDCVRTQFGKAGWQTAAPLSIFSLYRALAAATLNEPDPTAPITPYFYDTEPNTIGLQKETDRKTVRTRHHVRFWRTDFRLPGGTLYVGTASFDEGIKWAGIPFGITHSIAADIDTEREHIAEDLRQAGAVNRQEEIQFVPPMVGHNFSGDVFLTDGKASISFLKTCARK